MTSPEGAEGVACDLHQSPSDVQAPLYLAEPAEERLERHGAEVELAESAGNHRRHGDVYGSMRAQHPR